MELKFAACAAFFAVSAVWEKRKPESTTQTYTSGRIYRKNNGTEIEIQPIVDFCFVFLFFVFRQPFAYATGLGKTKARKHKTTI